MYLRILGVFQWFLLLDCDITEVGIEREALEQEKHIRNGDMEMYYLHVHLQDVMGERERETY